MHQSFNSWLSFWRSDLLRSSSKDSLVNLDLKADKFVHFTTSDEKEIALPFDAKLKRLITENNEISKNSGVQVLCVIREILVWENDGQFLHTPISLSECDFKIDKINQVIHLTISENTFLNPFLEKTFEHKFDTSLGEFIANGQLPENWKIVAVNILGNFHYHRFTLLKDFDEYENTQNIQQTPLGFFIQEKISESSKQSKLKRNSKEHYIYPMDSDQFDVFDKISRGENLVVEGPPGSGKSQVLTNTLFRGAFYGKQVVLCSEKRNALQVVFSKFRQKKLDLFCQNITNDSEGKSDFVKSLQSAWIEVEKRASQSNQKSSAVNWYFDEKAALELKLQRLALFPKISKPITKPPFELSVYPDLETYQSYREALFDLNKTCELMTSESLNKSAFLFLKAFVFEQATQTQYLISELKRFLSRYREVNQELKVIFEIDTISQLAKVQRSLIHAQILSQDLFCKNENLFVEGTKEFKRFLKDNKEFQVVKGALELYEKQEGFKWGNFWSKQELTEALKSFKEDAFWNLKYRKWKQKFVKAYNPEVFTRELAIGAIESCLNIHDLIQKEQEIKDRFNKLGILHPDLDIPIVLQLQRSVNRDAEGLMQTRQKYTKLELAQILKHQDFINDFYRFVNHHFINLGEKNLFEIIEKIISQEAFIVGQHQRIAQLLKLDSTLSKYLSEVESFDSLDDAILHGEIKQFQSRNPELFHYQADDLCRDIQQLILKENDFFDFSVSAFWGKRVQTFIDYHQLISSVGTRLTDENREFRKKLKSGRSILIREFNKSRQHKSIRELLSSDAEPWIRLLKPILLLNPLMISKVLPNKPQSIDLMLFDEASQVPFSHAIPSVFRSKQLAVFGDSQQISPSSYFLQGAANRADLLSESRHFLSSQNLNFHYRSKHPSLIEFSNRYFYENRLEVLPAFINSSTDGVFCHFVENAIYDGHNDLEAQKLIDFLVERLPNIPTEENIGVVAFSEKQLNLLSQKAQENASSNLVYAIQSGRINFCTIEKVQGDEFDVLFISLAYGKDAYGNFANRFGPVNHENGEKRLNVLFSRARRELHFFHSIHAHDFSVSDNLGVQSLKNFLLMHENKTWLKHDSDESINQVLEITDPFYRINAVEYLMTVFRHSESTGLGVNLKFRKDA